MYPVFARIGPFSLYSYSIMLLAAFVASWLLARWYGPRVDLTRAVVGDLVLAAALGGIVGARALYVATFWREFVANPLWIPQLQRGGMVFYGGLAGGALTVGGYTLVRKLPFSSVADTAGITVPLGAAIGRIGCFLNGCCAGRPTEAWFGCAFPGGAGRVVPAQLLDSAGNLLVLTVLLVVAVRLRPPRGTLWWGFLAGYAVERFAVEMMRVNPPVLSWLSQAQVISLAILPVAVAGLAVTLRRARHVRARASACAQAEGEEGP